MLAASVLAAAVWISVHLVVHPVLHTAGLFVHLAALVGLIASGCVLEPNLASMLTRTKLALVLVLTLNGPQAMMLSKRLDQHWSAALPPRVLIWAAATGVVSQICWWGAVLIGFWNAEH
ncbi:hypothetical protein IU459_14925 [Nocardia amamiensis]|uniref:Copper resistance protein D domain-containing protein n=1 Tax=Nocardia amamiensis TaxID=404578 RepID=A0ABS0CQC7_9NOCA|nr:hypothetical protein [Nocardia amamiensis]